MESKGIRGGGSQQVDPAGPASLSPKSLALSRQIDSHANMAICHARAQSPMPSFLPQTTTPKLAAYIYTPARVPAGPRCPAAHGLAHRSGVPFFFFLFFASERRACSGSIVHAEGRANRAGEAGHVLVDTSAAPWPLGRRRWSGCTACLVAAARALLLQHGFSPQSSPVRRPAVRNGRAHRPPPPWRAAGLDAW